MAVRAVQIVVYVTLYTILVCEIVTIQLYNLLPMPYSDFSLIYHVHCQLLGWACSLLTNEIMFMTFHYMSAGYRRFRMPGETSMRILTDCYKEHIFCVISDWITMKKPGY